MTIFCTLHSLYRLIGNVTEPTLLARVIGITAPYSVCAGERRERASADDFLQSRDHQLTACLFADILMPGMSDLELHATLQVKQRPHTTTLTCLRVRAHLHAPRRSRVSHRSLPKSLTYVSFVVNADASFLTASHLKLRRTQRWRPPLSALRRIGGDVRDEA